MSRSFRSDHDQPCNTDTLVEATAVPNSNKPPHQLLPQYGPDRFAGRLLMSYHSTVQRHLKYSGAFRNRTFRRIWLIWVATTIGIWLGNLLSMALVAGWSAEGIAWRLAPGLAAIACVAMLGPPLTKSNPYCNHLCPHGAIQQLIRPHHKSGRYRKLKPNLSRFLRYVPGLTLCFAYIALVMFLSIDLASWEPFHAYLFRITGWGSLVFAFATLLFLPCFRWGIAGLGVPQVDTGLVTDCEE